MTGATLLSLFLLIVQRLAKVMSNGGFDFDRMRDPSKSENSVEEKIARSYQGENGEEEQEATQNFVEDLALRYKKANKEEDESE